MRTLNVERRTLNVEVKKCLMAFRSSVRRSTFKVQRSTFAFALILAFLDGCCWFCPKPPPPKSAYYGDTDPMDRVIADINKNNARVPTLWTQLNYSADLVDPDKHTTENVSGDGGLMYAHPRSLLIHGSTGLAGQVFAIGSNDNEFWVQIRATADTSNYWWGHYSNLGKPGCRPIPIRPDLVLEVLGVGLYGPDFLQQPVPVMRFDNEHDSYVFDLNYRSADRWETAEEIWYTRDTRLPNRVVLYGRNGKATLIADLSKHVAVQADGTPKTDWPKVASHYDLFYPENKTRIVFDFLDPVQLQHAGSRGSIPNANTFERIEPDVNNKVMQIDADCAPGGAAMAPAPKINAQ